METVRQVTDTEPVSPRLLNPSVPRDLETICLKCLEKEPHKRYATAQHLAEDLGRFLQGEPILARHAKRIEQIMKWARRRPAAAALVGVCLLGSLLLVLGLTVGNILISRALDDRTLALSQLKNQQRATKQALAEVTQSEERVLRTSWEARVAQARANRRSGHPGQRLESLQAIADAAALIPKLKLGEAEALLLRNEAIAAMALPDLSESPALPAPPAGVHLVFDPEMKQCAFVDSDGIATIHRLEDGEELFRVAGIYQKSQLQISRGGRYLGIRSRALAVWDVQTRERILVDRDIQHDDGSGLANPFDFRPDALQVAVGRSHGAVAIYNLATAKLEHEFATLSHPQFVHYHPGGETLAVASHGSSVVEVWNLGDQPHLHLRISHQDPVWLMTWVGEGSVLATVTRFSGTATVRFWESSTGKRVGMCSAPSIWAIGSNAGGDIVATSGLDCVLRLWDAESAQPLFVVPSGDYNEILRFPGVGNRVAYVRRESQFAFLEVLPPAECREVQAHVSDARVRQDDRWIVSRSQHEGFAFWDRQWKQQLAFVKLRDCHAAILHPDGERVITSGGRQVLAWPIRQSSGMPLEIGPAKVLHSSDGTPIGRAVLDAARKTLAFVLSGQRVVVLDLQADPPREIFSGKHPGIQKLAISPDGCWVATAPWNAQSIHIWNVAERKHELRLPGTDRLRHRRAMVVFSPDSKRLVSGVPGEYRIWSVGDWELTLSIPVSNPGSLLSPATFSPDGRLLAICPTRNSVRLVDANDGNEIASLTASHPRYIAASQSNAT